MIVSTLLILACYVILICCLLYGFHMKSNSKSVTDIARNSFTIIVPFRNEEKYLHALLKSIEALEYPLHHFEVILVDDDSSDVSTDIIKRFQQEHPLLDMYLISNKRISNSPKKDAITTAIYQAKYDWILTTDADCVVPSSWLMVLNDFIASRKANMVLLPVMMSGGNTFLHQFQIIDFLSLQGVTIGSSGLGFPLMANGANLAYRKSLFIQLNGYADNNTIASGDDVFLLQSFLNYDKEGVLFLKDAQTMVKTATMDSWRGLVQQRIRWASKTAKIEGVSVKLVGVIVLMSNAMLLLSYVASFYNPIFLIYMTVKFGMDVLMIVKTNKLYKQEKPSIGNLLLALFFYPLFVSYIGFLSLFKSFSWKGRQF